MARRIRWQIVLAALSTLLIAGLLGRLALLSASVDNPLAGGSYREALVGTPQQAIPLLNDPLNDPTGFALGSLLFDGLVRIGADGLVEPALAESYELDPSGEVYTFRLRRDIRWHDGTPLTANDVVFTLRAFQSMSDPGDAAAAQLWSNVLVDRIDDYTIRCTLSEPLAAFLSNARLPILPAHLLSAIPPEEWASSAYADQLIGTGPFQLAELREDGATLQANPNYYGGRPYLDQVELSFMASPEAAFAALTRGDVTAFGMRTSGDLSGVSRNLAAINPGGNPTQSEVPLDEYAILTFNLQRSPLNQLPLRQALAYGLNKDALIERALGGLARPLDTPILPGLWAANPDVSWYAPDQATAERLLGELNYEPSADGIRRRDNQELAFTLLVDSEPQRVAAAEEIARQWGVIGVRITVEQLGAPELLERLNARDYDLALHSWVRLGADPDPLALWHSSEAQSGLNYAGLEDEQIDTMLESAHSESELAARSADYAAFQQRWVELAPSITLYQPMYVFAFGSNLGGVGFADPQSPTSQLLFGPEDRYRSVTRWFINSYREIQGDLR